MLSIVVPAYNEEETLALTCERLSKVCADLRSQCAITQTEVIFVDDGSRDKTAQVLKVETAKHQTDAHLMRVLQFSRNFGHSAAVFAGLENAKGDLVAIVDADLQDPPELLIAMVQKLRAENVDVVYGQRLKRAGESVFKKITAWFFYRFINILSGTDIPKDTGDFRVITREVCDTLIRLQEPEPFMRGLVAWIGYKQLAFPYDRQPRVLGETKYPFKRMLRFALQAILSFSSFPLKLSLYLGLMGIVLSFLMAGFAFTIWWEGRALPGWTSLMIMFSFFQSVTLILIGGMGLYVGRVHTATQHRPRFILRKDVR